MFKGKEIPEESLKCRNLLLVSKSTKLKTVAYTSQHAVSRANFYNWLSVVTVEGIILISSSFISSRFLFSSLYLFPAISNYPLIFRPFIPCTCHVHQMPLIHIATYPLVRFTNTGNEWVWIAEVAGRLVTRGAESNVLLKFPHLHHCCTVIALMVTGCSRSKPTSAYTLPEQRLHLHVRQSVCRLHTLN